MFSNQRFFVVILSSIVVLLFSVSSFGSAAVTGTGANSLFMPPAQLIRIGQVTSIGSYNWAGYAIDASTDSVSQVKGSWKQASVSCPKSGSEAVAFWTGIDGLTDGTVEQTGTTAQCSNGAVSYYAWYEFYPSGSVEITSMKIQPGNVISATVKYSTSTSKFTTTIKDVTTGRSFSESATVSGALRSSAEWIVEVPEACTSLISCSLLSLPDFQTASFGRDFTSVSSTNTATVSGSNKEISQFGSMVDSLTMVTEPVGLTVMAHPSSLSTDGTSFSVTWQNSGP
jgi:hypothetical protein